MEESVTISLERYEKLREIEKAAEKKVENARTDINAMSQKIKFSNTIFTLWTRFLLESQGVEDHRQALEILAKEFELKGTNARIEIVDEGDLFYVIPKQKTTDYI